MSDRCVAPWSKFHDGPEFFRITALPSRPHSDLAYKHPAKKARPIVCHFADGRSERYRSTCQAAEYTGATELIIYNAISRRKRGGQGWCHTENGDFWPELMEAK